MPKEIYSLPIPSSWIGSPKFFARPKRLCEIVCENREVEKSEIKQVSLKFNNCWAVKFTYYVANDAELISLTYDKVVDFGATDWLLKIKSNIAINKVQIEQIRHFAIFFDDGPLYEFVCESFCSEEVIL